MSDVQEEIIEALQAIDFRRPYTRGDAETIADQIVRAYDLLSGLESPEFLKHWQTNQLATAFSDLCLGWLSASANCVALSLATDVSQEPFNLKMMAERFKEVSPHIDGAIKALRNPAERDSLLSRYVAAAA